MNPLCTRTARALATWAALTCTSLVIAAAPANAEGTHDGHVAPPPPAGNDPRFLPGTVGPVVFRGTAATVVIPDGPGFGGEKGRTQNSGDRRKNNYSVTDANYSNVLGLLPRHPDTGAPLSYVQHIQTYAAAGFIEVFAPDTYAHLVMHQARGEGTVLGGAAYLMGLVKAYDAAAHGIDPATIPATLPGTSIDSEWYVRSPRDVTGQQWARPHHAQTAPGVYRMLHAAGVPSTPALILASDDGLSGSGRLNGVNEQDGGAGGFNSGERSTWALAAQVQLQTGVPVVEHMMHGHDHAGVHSSALTKPRINASIGYLADAREASPERAAAIFRVLHDGTIASEATAAADSNLVFQNSYLLRNDTELDVDLPPADHMLKVGQVISGDVVVENRGPHLARATTVTLEKSPHFALSFGKLPAGVSCTGLTCSVGDLVDDQRVTIPVTLKAVRWGQKANLRAYMGSTTEHAPDDDVHGHAVWSRTSGTFAFANKRGAPLKCGATLARRCVMRLGHSSSGTGRLGPAAYDEGGSGRWVKVQYQLRGRDGVWRTRFEKSTQVNAATGRLRTKAARWDLKKRGLWRARLGAESTWLASAYASRWRYVQVR